MCCKNEFNNMPNQENHFCSCKMKTTFQSKKKRIELLKNYLTELEEKADDIKECIKELEAVGGSLHETGK